MNFACDFDKLGMQLYNEQLRQRKEMEESAKRQEEELEKTKKEKEEACLISKNLMQLYEDEVMNESLRSIQKLKSYKSEFVWTGEAEERNRGVREEKKGGA